MYHTGLGVAKDVQAAMKYLSLAVEQGHGAATYYLATMYRYGNDVERNHKVIY